MSAEWGHLTEYAGRIRHLDHDNPAHGPIMVTIDDINQQARNGWPDFHPETYCNRCGNPNTEWAAADTVWNPVMRPDDRFGPWHEIICIPCFIEMAERLWGERSWRITRGQQTGIEYLHLLDPQLNSED